MKNYKLIDGFGCAIHFVNIFLRAPELGPFRELLNDFVMCNLNVFVVCDDYVCQRKMEENTRVRMHVYALHKTLCRHNVLYRFLHSILKLLQHAQLPIYSIEHFLLFDRCKSFIKCLEHTHMCNTHF